jgi:hypothetical protein
MRSAPAGGQARLVATRRTIHGIRSQNVAKNRPLPLGHSWITLACPVPAAWGHADCPCQWCLLTSRRLVIFLGRSSIPGGRCSQGGVKIPTGGKGDVAQARERLLLPGSFPLGRKGQQIRCDSEADGYSPDERERFAAAFARLRAGRRRSVCPDSGPERGKP